MEFCGSLWSSWGRMSRQTLVFAVALVLIACMGNGEATVLSTAASNGTVSLYLCMACQSSNISNKVCGSGVGFADLGANLSCISTGPKASSFGKRLIFHSFMKSNYSLPHEDQLPNVTIWALSISTSEGFNVVALYNSSTCNATNQVYSLKSCNASLLDTCCPIGGSLNLEGSLVYSYTSFFLTALPEPTPTPSPSDDNNNSLPGWAIAVIVVGVLLGVVALGGLLAVGVLYARRRKRAAYASVA